MATHYYIPRLRPASHATLPAGVRWGYHCAPAIYGIAHRPDLPQSRHPYGEIFTDRALTLEECDRFDLTDITPPETA